MKIWSLLASRKAWLGFVLLALVSCGTDSHHFSLDGHFLKMNQGEFYVYSPDGAVNGIDTIKVQGGRFTYEIPCDKEGTLVIVLPNFSEIPVFAKPGESVDIKADASHIKDIEVTGTDENEDMTTWRKNTSSLSPDELTKHAEQFIRENPKSIISRWMLRKYFIVCAKPNYRKARDLAVFLSKNGEENSAVSRILTGLEHMPLQAGQALPSFSATDIHGKKVQASSYRNGTAIFILCAAWSYDSMSMLRQISSRIKENKSQGKPGASLVGISVDASLFEFKRTLGNDSTLCTAICDGQMWEGTAVEALGFSTVPDNILVRNGKVVAAHVSKDELLRELDK